ncbi:MAG: hypothetical protein KQJ78_17790 [Deltaproteobacteria bacterium]|nr:hypothetical protein [Deltaproteobacteria bacterium]
MKAQITLTVNEAKRLIAKGLAAHPAVRKALAGGRIFLKGGTTVSAVAEELVGRPLRISGRISPRGAKTAADAGGGFHCALIENGELLDIEDRLPEVVAGLGGDDVAITGANAIDVYGNAALMFGAPGGGGPGIIIAGLMGEIPNVFIAAGLEKLVPGPLTAVTPRAARKGVGLSMGMAVGLTPLAGAIISEDRALALLAPVEVTVIGRGGLWGAEGATTLLIEGEEGPVREVFRLAQAVKGAQPSGTERSRAECAFPHAKCRGHVACMYKRRQAPAGPEPGQGAE